MSHVGEVLKLPLMHQKSFITRTAWHKRSLPEATRLVFGGGSMRIVKNIGETGHEHIYIHTFSIFPCMFSLLQSEISLPLGHALVMRAQSPADCLCGNKYPDLHP